MSFVTIFLSTFGYMSINISLKSSFVKSSTNILVNLFKNEYGKPFLPRSEVNGF